MKISRRQFQQILAGGFLFRAANLSAEEAMGSLTDVPGIQVGHFTSTERPTGCTVVLFDPAATVGVDVRGSAPGTRETDLLKPGKTVERVDAILLSGGSAFGLDAATGVVRFLEKQGRGFPTSAGPVPIVPAAILYDLGLGDPKLRPDAESGRQACRAASRNSVEEGNVGAGTGATVGKMLGGEHAMKGGLGSASLKVENLVVGVLAAVNCVGNVRDPKSGAVLAGARAEKAGFADLEKILRTRNLASRSRSGENTTLVVAATNARFDKAELTKLAEMSHDGLARTIDPVHLPFDGDTSFAASTGRLNGFSLAQVGSLVAHVTAMAVVRAITQAESLPDYPAYRDYVAKARDLEG